MKKGTKKGTLTVLEAMEELSRFAELDEKKAVSELSESWTDPSQRESNQEKVKETFRVLHSYLRQVYDKGAKEAESTETSKGVQALMIMANEAAEKIDRCTALFKGLHGGGGVTHLKEFQDLQDFYLHKIKKKFHASLAKEEAWEAEWGGGEVDLHDIQRRGLKDLETVKRDKEYELFFIRKEDGNPFFSRNLLRHIKLVGKFDETLVEVTGEDPFAAIKTIEDRTAHNAAREIMSGLHNIFEPFVKEAMLTRESPLVCSVTKAMMALMLASNPRNFLQNTENKYVAKYFHDFVYFIREAVRGETYARAIEQPYDQLSSATKHALKIIHHMAGWLFTRQAHANETAVFLKTLFAKASYKHPLTTIGNNPLWVWHSLLEEDEYFRQFLSQYPNGPLMKTLDIMKEGDEHEGFDPLYQMNLPHILFRASQGDIDFDVLRLPSPTWQKQINQAEVVPEFMAFLRGLAAAPTKRKFLVINLQNRTSWNEHARCVALEDLQKKTEFSDVLYVANFPKETEFYSQAGIYENLEDAKAFKDLLIEQVESGESCGYVFPHAIQKSEILSFAKKASTMIHETVFGGKKVLTRKNRLDFIELFYYCLALKLIELVRPSYFSFTCKDAIDTSAVTTAGLYAFLKILSDEPTWRVEDKELLYRFLYQGALLRRERAVEHTNLHRFVSACSVLQAEMEDKKDKLRATCEALYKQPLLKLKLAA